MELIEQEKIFLRKMLEIGNSINIESQLPSQVFREKYLMFRIIDFDEIYSAKFFQNINNLLKEEDNIKWTFAVLENSPQDFFYKLCRKYPIFEVTSNDSFEDYLSITRDELECIPNESLADNAYIIVIYPESLKWVIYGDFNFEIGIVGFSDNETMEQFTSTYEANRAFTIEKAISELLEVIYRDHKVPEDMRNQLLHNYGK
jgi:hypothetical protein